jgi:hypothetical protein
VIKDAADTFCVYNHWGSVIDQAVSRRILTAETSVCAQVSSCEICGAKIDTAMGVSPNPSLFPCQCHSIAAPYSLMYHLAVGQRARLLPSSRETQSHGIAAVTCSV